VERAGFLEAFEAPVVGHQTAELLDVRSSTDDELTA
jgi:hypothetical protein